MRLSKTDMLLIATILGAVVLIEHGNRTRMEAPTAADAPAIAVACPVNESVPFSPECMAFIQGSAQIQAPRRLVAPADGAIADSPELPSERPSTTEH